MLKSAKNTQKRTSIFPASMAGDVANHVEPVRVDGGEATLLFPGTNQAMAERRLRPWHRAAGGAGWPMLSTTRALWHPHDLRHAAAR